MISIAIPYHGNRMKWTMQTIANVGNLRMVDEIVVSIDPSDYPSTQLEKVLSRNRKVKVVKNEKNLFVFRNKVNAVQNCSSEWVALIDSDNVINHNYLVAAIGHDNVRESVIYQPARGYPKLNYDEFVKDNIGFKRASELMHNKKFDMLFNTMNYVFHRETWLKSLDGAIKDPYDPLTADAAYINYHCLKAGMVIKVIPDMTYIHTIHDKSVDKSVQSSYILYSKESWREYCKIRERLINENSESSTGVLPKGREPISQTSNWSGSGGPSRDVLPPKGPSHKDEKNLLTD